MIGSLTCGCLCELFEEFPPPQKLPSLSSTSPPPPLPLIVNTAAAAGAAAPASAAAAAGKAGTAAALVDAESHAVGRHYIHQGGLKNYHAPGNALAVCPPAYPPSSPPAFLRTSTLPLLRRSPTEPPPGLHTSRGHTSGRARGLCRRRHHHPHWAGVPTYATTVDTFSVLVAPACPPAH